VSVRDQIAKILTFIRPEERADAEPRHAFDGLERATAPPLETSSYEFMLENLVDLPSDRFDRWRNRMPQG
jgi:hypothetical protein